MWSVPLVVVAYYHALAGGCWKKAPIMQMPGPEILPKLTEVNGLTIQQVMFEDVRVCQTLHG